MMENDHLIIYLKFLKFTVLYNNYQKFFIQTKTFHINIYFPKIVYTLIHTIKVNFQASAFVTISYPASKTVSHISPLSVT